MGGFCSQFTHTFFTLTKSLSDVTQYICLYVNSETEGALP